MNAGRTAAPNRVERKICLHAEISFDGKLLEPSPNEIKVAPVWWQRLLARKCTIRAAPDTVRAMFEAERVDELCVRVRPCFDGRSGQPTLSGPNGDEPFFAGSITWTLARMATTPAGDCLLHYRRRLDG